VNHSFAPGMGTRLVGEGMPLPHIPRFPEVGNKERFVVEDRYSSGLGFDNFVVVVVDTHLKNTTLKIRI